ncbi:MAG TPA: hypothetical protein PLV19_03935 [Nitrosomonas sp.]|jgi:hypothetical protein|nr:hypothetical protein [Nitrosomonas sp.]HQX13304.1 hypothetical protein [Nitrosomonas sp.]HRB31785.1 hypothetical protein [Nitrosomonas sp.]HRB44375.1 hypothetical protein [Nitrosomonas sp.]HRB78025.1 hypothetical protein [Nitrosomonas sp.]
MIKKIMRTTILISVLTIFVSACSTTQKITPTLRTATEQLLLTESVLRSLPKDRDMPFPIPRGSKVKLEVSGVSPDKDLVKSVVAGWMGMHGYIPQDENASHRINIVVNSLGTEYATTFFGIPPINASLIPIATPELAFYKSESQLGYSRFHFDIFEVPSGKFLASSSPFRADAFYNMYTVLFLFKFNKSDLVSPPEIKTFTQLVK